jgi:hypothetical protein
LHNKAVGYTQGMSSIAAMLLTFIDDEEVSATPVSIRIPSPHSLTTVLAVLYRRPSGSLTT